MADRFRKAREHLGMDQDEFAQLINASRSTVGNYESGTTKRPVGNIVAAWALATGTTVQWLLTGRTPDAGPGTGTRAPRSRSHQAGVTSEYPLFPRPRPVPWDVPLRQVA